MRWCQWDFQKNCLMLAPYSCICLWDEVLIENWEWHLSLPSRAMIDSCKTDLNSVSKNIYTLPNSQHYHTFLNNWQKSTKCRKNHTFTKRPHSPHFAFKLSKYVYVLVMRQTLGRQIMAKILEMHEAKGANSDDLVSTYFVRTGQVTWI